MTREKGDLEQALTAKLESVGGDKVKLAAEIERLQGELQAHDRQSNETISGLQQQAATTAEEYRAELARQKQAAADALSEATARLTREKGDLEQDLTAKLERVWAAIKSNWPRRSSVYKANYKPMIGKVMKRLVACSNK